MDTARRFANYPRPQEASDIDYNFAEDKNPALRGLPLAIAASLVTRSSFVSRYLFDNAGFGKIKLIPGLAEVRWRPESLVIPLDHDGDSSPSPLEFDEELTQPQPADVAGRFLSAADYHALYRAGQVTPVHVVDALLPLISDRAASDHAIAWTEVRADEVHAAAKASAERWAAGKPLGILDGVPIGVKSDTAVKGFVSTVGMKPDKRFPFFTTPATETVWCVKKLEEAGAIVMGKMNMHEIGLDVSGCNPAIGTPVNWYNRSYFPGGSSSGAGSALGGGIVPIAVGTDAGGSLRVPACFNGIYSLKGTYGRIPSQTLSVCVTGPMAGTAADLAIAYRVMTQPEPSDPVSCQFARSKPPGTSGKKYIGVCRPWVARSAPAVLEAFNKTLEYLTTKLGYEAVDIDLPHLQDGQRVLSIICLAEAVERAKGRVEGRPDEWLSVVHAPNRILLSVGQHTSALDYLRCNQMRELVMRHLAHLFQRYPGLLVLTPTTPDAGWPAHPGDQRHGFSDGNASIRNMTYVWLANLSGCPAASCPVAYADPAQGDGRVPLGVMAMAEWGDEERLLRFARDAERYLRDGYAGGRLRPAAWVDVLALAGRAGGEAKAADGGASASE